MPVFFLYPKPFNPYEAIVVPADAEANRVITLVSH
jgi:hypothetical protein